ncbi:MAG: chemotaxis response regulator protein-glutamate methylesterase [Epsilonproteobacteria bacterium]|nr:chemotaxis response regulator protein-glutamate methylesterase [Campylobacterota bacterium]
MAKIKVLVVDDSALMRKAIREILEGDSEIDVIETAKDGYDALEKIHRLNPDVVTLDINMPNLDGRETLKKIMKEKPLPVVIVSSIVSEEAPLTFELLDMGAFDYVPKPSGTVSLNIKTVHAEIIKKVKNAYIYRNRVGKKTFIPRVISSTKTVIKAEDKKLAKYVVAIAISTGGPSTLFDVLQKVKAPQPDTAYLVVQHMPETFTAQLAKRLSEFTPIEFRHASSHEAIIGGYGYLAPGGHHMQIRIDERVRLFKDDKYLYYPSADVLFESVANVFGANSVGVILTGIGKDGATGLLSMKKKGAYTVAESEETAIVYGMPMEAKEIGAASIILPSYKIATEIDRALNKIRAKPNIKEGVV